MERAVGLLVCRRHRSRHLCQSQGRGTDQRPAGQSTAPCSPPSYIQPCRQALRPWSRARWPGWLNEAPIKRFNVGAGRAPLPLIPVLEQKTIHDLLLVLDLAGAFVFAISGAMLGVRRNLDIFGILVLSFAASSAGGITRDLLIGAVPPAAISDRSEERRVGKD